MSTDTNLEYMTRAVENADRVRMHTSPNPWVGAVVVSVDGEVFDGATEPPGSRHAERVALDAAGPAAMGATVYTTLEPCSHSGRTGPCTGALIEAGVQRVVVGIEDPDPLVAGTGLAQLEEAGISVHTGVLAQRITQQLYPYLPHRRTGRPYVVLKLAASLDGRTGAPDRTSQWITGEAARVDSHRLRAESDAVLVGAGTVSDDNPSLTVRHVDGPDPIRIVLGEAPAHARIHPCQQMTGPLDEILDQLGDQGIVQLMVEGGATAAGAFHRAGLVDRYQLYLAPALFGGDDALPLFAGPGASTIDELFRGRVIATRPLADGDLVLTLVPAQSAEGSSVAHG